MCWRQGDEYFVCAEHLAGRINARELLDRINSTRPSSRRYASGGRVNAPGQASNAR